MRISSRVVLEAILAAEARAIRYAMQGRDVPGGTLDTVSHLVGQVVKDAPLDLDKFLAELTARRATAYHYLVHTGKLDPSLELGE